MGSPNERSGPAPGARSDDRLAAKRFDRPQHATGLKGSGSLVPATTIVVDVTSTISTEEARALTDRLKCAVTLTGVLFAEARELEVWKALGYANFGAWATTEFNLSQSRAYQLADHAIVATALQEVTGSTLVELPERVARGLKPHLDLVLEEVGGVAEEVRQQGGDERAVAAAVVDRIETVRTFLYEQKTMEKENKLRVRRGWKAKPGTTTVDDVEERRRRAQNEVRSRPRPAHLKGTGHIDPVRCITGTVDVLVAEVDVLVSMVNEGLTSFDLLDDEQIARLEVALSTMAKFLGEVRR